MAGTPQDHDAFESLTQATGRPPEGRSVVSRSNPIRMILTDQYDGSADPLEGDRTIIWRSLPVGAQIVSATITVTPVAAPTGSLFEEIITFTGNLGSLGATKDGGSAFVEVDFHKRRTLAAVAGNSLTVATLQVDLGGLYVEINDKGAIKSPGDTLFQVTPDGLLPGLTVNKFKLTGLDPDITSVTIRSLPTNLSVTLGTLRPFWTVTGELSTSATSRDFSTVLQKFLLTANVENGFCVVPLVIHSDTVARLQLELDVEYVNQAALLAPGVLQAVLPFDFGTIQNASPGVLSINLPAGAHVLPGQTAVRVTGAFADTRIVPGIGLPVGMPLPAAPAPVVTVSADESQAQSLVPASGFLAVSADLLLAALSPATKLSLDVRGDVSGEPDSASLLPEPVLFTVTAIPGQQLTWVNVPFAQPFNFEAGPTYWLVLMSLQGDGVWSVNPAPSPDPGVQHTLDGGLSWRQAGALKISGPLAAAFRLRNKPDRFQIPIQVHVGDAGATVPMALDSYAPLGRVDFMLDVPQLAHTFNHYLRAGVPPALPEGEHLTNGDFGNWAAAGNSAGLPLQLTLSDPTTPAFAVAPDGKWVYLTVERPGHFAILIVDALCHAVGRRRIRLQALSRPLAMAVHPSGRRAYVITAKTLHVVDLAGLAELGAALNAGQFADVIGVIHPGVYEILDFGTKLALSPDGGRLYLTLADSLASVGTAALESVVTGLRPLARQDTRSSPIPSTELAAMALTPDGTRLFLATSRSSTIQILDTASFVMEADGIDLPNNPVSLDFTPDGTMAIAATVEKNTVTLIDTNSGLVMETGALRARPMAVAASPDGTRTYVAVADERNELEAERDAESARIPEPLEFIAMKALTLALVARRAEEAVIVPDPQGDAVYVNVPGSDLTVVPVAKLIPAGWSVTSRNPSVSGEVTPVCFPSEFPFAYGVEFGRRSNRGMIPNRSAIGLSQVVPVMELCPFEFSFEAVADEPGGLAELLWLDPNSNLLKRDRVALQTQPGGSSNSLWKRSARAVASERLIPLLHRARLTSPAGTSQVEVRYTVPAGAAAIVANTSLNATTQAVVNSDLQDLQQGVPAGWTLVPPAIRGVSFSPALGGAIHFVNSSMAAVDLVQLVEIGENQQYTFEFLGRVLLAQTASQTAGIGIRWQKEDGSPAADPISLTIPVAGFGRYSAAGTTAQATGRAELHLTLPGGMALEVTGISLKTMQSALVQVAFVSEAPGELRVSGPVVSYDRVPVPPPEVPSGGLAAPTPPGQTPGVQMVDEPVCSCCGMPSSDTNVGDRVLMGRRLRSRERCPECGTKLPPDRGESVVRLGPRGFPKRIPVEQPGRSARSPALADSHMVIAGRIRRPTETARRTSRKNRVIADKDK